MKANLYLRINFAGSIDMPQPNLLSTLCTNVSLRNRALTIAEMGGYFWEFRQQFGA